MAERLVPGPLKGWWEMRHELRQWSWEEGNEAIYVIIHSLLSVQLLCFCLLKQISQRSPQTSSFIIQCGLSKLALSFDTVNHCPHFQALVFLFPLILPPLNPLSLSFSFSPLGPQNKSLWIFWLGACSSLFLMHETPGVSHSPSGYCHLVHDPWATSPALTCLLSPDQNV